MTTVVIVLLVASSEVSVSAMIVLWSSIVLPRIEMLMPLIIIVGSRHLLILLHDLKQLLKDLCNVGVRLPVTCMRGAELLSHVLLEVSLVDCVLDLNFSVLFDFIMVDQKWSTFESHIIQTLLGSSGIIRRSETHESKIPISASVLQLYLLNLTVFFE